MSDLEVTPYQESWTYHRCSIQYDIQNPHYGKGSLWKCDTCGQHWVKTKCIPRNQPLNMFAGEWEKVYWFMFRTKRRIRELEAVARGQS